MSFPKVILTEKVKISQKEEFLATFVKSVFF